MKNYLVPLLFIIILLSSCIPKVRVDYNWEQYSQNIIENEIIVYAGIDRTWDALKGAGEDVGLSLVVEDKESGLLTYTKNDESFDNVFLHLSVLASPISSSESVINLRGFAYSNRFRAYSYIKIIPSDGTLEKEFMSAVLVRLKDTSTD